MPLERLQKILAQAGYGSRRQCETLIDSGRVRVNGHLASIGDKADSTVDHITLDQAPVGQAENLTYILLNKPRGVESTLTENSPRLTVRNLVTANERLYPVGRLDADSEGLILLTNDGELTQRLTHPRYRHEKEYNVLVHGYPDNQQLDRWRRGVTLDDGVKTAPAGVRFIRKGASGTWLRVTMREGRKRQIRRSAAKLGLRVKRLQRMRMSTLRLGKLAPGDWRKLSAAEISELRRQVLHPSRNHKPNVQRASRPHVKDTGPDS